MYLDNANDAGKPTERLLDLRKAVDKTGLSTIEQRGLNTEDLCFQSYDVAAAMSGKFNGAQKKLSEIVGRDIPYIPCQAHRCNPVIEHSCNASVIVREMFDILYCKHFLRLFIFSLKNLLFTLLPQTNQFRFTRIVTLTIKQSNYR